jgi:predicted Zn-dependent protease with MMP-like domain
MDDRSFEELVRKAVKKIPDEFLQLLENVEIVTQDRPYDYQSDFFKKRGERGVLLGLYEGIPQTKRGRYGVGSTVPDKITIFKNSLISISRDLDDLEKNVRRTVVHEIGHHFGMSEGEIRSAMMDID